MASPTLSEGQPLPDEDNDVLLPRGWAEASLAQADADGEDEPNVLRGLD
jgi:hypothetical protein